jgi:hypothetical protein
MIFWFFKFYLKFVLFVQTYFKVNNFKKLNAKYFKDKLRKIKSKKLKIIHLTEKTGLSL